MLNVKVVARYHDIQPRTTIRNGKSIEDKDIFSFNGEERFEAKVGDLLTVSKERAKFLVEDLKVAEYHVEYIEKAIIDEEVETAIKTETKQNKTNTKKNNAKK